MKSRFLLFIQCTKTNFYAYKELNKKLVCDSHSGDAKQV